MNKASHPLIDTLLKLQGNPRICVFTEPLWGIPFNLYVPYVSVYMLALGLNDSQIGLISTVGLSFQIIMSLISGPVTDKLGRRFTTFFFDIISWSFPMLMYAFAQNFWHFFIAAILASVMRITANSWVLLLVEDAPKNKLVSIWSWITIAAIISGLFAPLAGLLVAHYSMVTAVRILHINAFVMMSAKFILLYVLGTETKQGLVKMKQTASVPLWKLFGGNKGALRGILNNPYTLCTFFISLIILVYDTVKMLFLSVFVVKQLALPESAIALLPFLRSILMLLFYFFVIPHMNHLKFRRPFLAGFALLLLSNIALVCSPQASFVFVILSTLLDAAGFALITPFKETLVVDAVDPHERAGIMGVFNVSMLVLASPFGYIAGVLSERSRYYPFFFLMLLALAGILIIYRISFHKTEFSAE